MTEAALHLNFLASKHGTDKGRTGYLKRSAKYYTDIYADAFADLRHARFTLIEIGCGGSLLMWRDFFEHAEIHGLDINPRRLPGVSTHYCDQSNAAEIEAVVDRIIWRRTEVTTPNVKRLVAAPPLYIVVDDGSHVAEHADTTARMILPLLAPGGFYAIEDLHADPPGFEYIIGNIERVFDLETVARTKSMVLWKTPKP